MKIWRMILCPGLLASTDNLVFCSQECHLIPKMVVSPRGEKCLGLYRWQRYELGTISARLEAHKTIASGMVSLEPNI